MRGLYFCLLWALSFSANAGDRLQLAKGCLLILVGKGDAGRMVLGELKQIQIERALTRHGQPTLPGSAVELPAMKENDNAYRIRGKVGEVNGLTAIGAASDLREKIQQVNSDPRGAGQWARMAKYKGLVLPEVGKQRTTREIEAWMDFLKSEMQREHFTAEEFFAILDVGFATDNFSFAKLVDFANVKSLKFIGKQNVLLRTLLGGFFKAKATLVTPTQKAPEIHLKLYGDLPKDPEDMAIYLSEVAMVLHRAAAKKLEQQTLDTAGLLGVSEGIYHLDNKMIPGTMELKRGFRQVHEGLQKYLDLKWAEARPANYWDEEAAQPTNSWEEPPVHRPKGKTLPLGKWDTNSGAVPNLWFHAKAITKGVFTWKPPGINIDIVDMVIEPLALESPAYVHTTQKEIEIPSTSDDLYLEHATARGEVVAYFNTVSTSRPADGESPVKASARERAISYYVSKALGKWSSRMWNALAIGTTAASIFTLTDATQQTVQQGKDQTREVAGNLNREVKSGVAVDVVALKRDYSEARRKQKELIDLSQKEAANPNFDEAAFAKLHDEVIKQTELVDKLHGKLEGAFKENE